MTRQISLTVNDAPINLDYFVAGYLDHVAGGIVGSLKDTGEIETLELTVDNAGVTINLNGAAVPLTAFPVQIIRSTLSGVLAPLKGVDKDRMDRVRLTIRR